MLMLILRLFPLCVNLLTISIHLMLMLILLRLRKDISLVHFNTSHVNVNRQHLLPKLFFHHNFNTSHVNVNLANCLLFRFFLYHFNTSHVNVNQLWILLYHTVYAISIHLMLMLIGFCNREEVHNRRISIHLMLMLIQEDAHEGKTAN